MRIDPSPQEIKSWLLTHHNAWIRIHKEEDGDQDLAELELKDVKLVPHRDYDNYLSAHALLLNGRGTIATEFGNKSLPHDFYEIALTNRWSASTDKNTLRLQTERGHYTISVSSDI